MVTQTVHPFAAVRQLTTLEISPAIYSTQRSKKVDRPGRPNRPGRTGGTIPKKSVASYGKSRPSTDRRPPGHSRSSPKTPTHVASPKRMASTPSSSNRSPVAGANTILPYRMHVSQRYLDLTRQKLGLTRLPREAYTRQQQRNHGVSKAMLEPLIDHWSEDYDWRAQEAFYNEALPQYRFAIHGTRIHFVHKRSMSPNAIPLLIAHGWPESFISVTSIIDALSNPVSTPPRGDKTVPTFHVVVPSIPGCGFSDPVAEEGNNITTTAEAFDSLMKSLGYSRYIAHGSGWGFKICRVIALMHSESCMAIHTSNPKVPPPQTNFTYAPHSMPNTPMPSGSPMHLEVPGMTPPLASPGIAIPCPPRERPQTVSYALCDSPSGLLAYMVDAIELRLPETSEDASSPSPNPTGLQNPWTPTSVLDWTMLYWLPGPEVALRWLTNSAPMVPSLWLTHSNVPLAVSQFGDQNVQQPAPMWIEAYHRIAMVRRRTGSVRFASWERPMDVIHDLRDLAGLVGPSYFGAFGAYGQCM